MAAIHPNNGNSTKSLVSMRDYVDLIYKEQQDDLDKVKELLCVKIDALDKATTLAKENMDLRMVNTNEWRNTMNDVIKLLASKSDLGKLEEKVAELEITRERLFARKDMVEKLDERTAILELSKAAVDGKASMNALYVAYAFSVIGIIISVIKFFIK